MKKKIAIIFIAVLLIGIAIFIYGKYGQKNNDYAEKGKINENKIENESNVEEIEMLKSEFGVTGNSDIYGIYEEYDGRKTLIIKPSVQYKTVMAGIINKGKPDFSEVDKILEGTYYEKESGIAISEGSRDKFLEILKTVANAKYSINSDGFLEQKKTDNMNEYDNKISKMLASQKFYLIDIESKCYMLDEVTGEVMEYPFEMMDPYTKFEYFESNNKTIFVISNNELGKIDYKETIKEILENINL